MGHWYRTASHMLSRIAKGVYVLKLISRRIAIVVIALTSISILGPAHGDGSDSKSKEVKGSIVGKVEVKSERDRGKSVKVAYVKVTLAQDESGKSIAKLLGATLKVIGPKAGKVVKFSGKDVRISGKIRKGKEIFVHTVTIKKMGAGGSETKVAGKTKRGGTAGVSEKSSPNVAPNHVLDGK